MLKDLYQKISQEKDIRQNLIQLREELKDGSNKAAFLYQLGADYSIFEKLLDNEDAKIRKNAALIMGELGVPSFLELLYQSYLKEEQLYVKSSYLIAIKNFNYDKIIPDLKERLTYLTNNEIKESDKKHIKEEIRALSELILTGEGIRKHEFTGYNVSSEIVLLTNRNFKYITTQQLETLSLKEFNAGIILKTEKLRDILPIRTYSEMLFVLEDLKCCNSDVNVSAKAIASSSLIQFMLKRHKGEVPFYFRIELKSTLPLDKKSAFTKKLSFEIERLTDRSLINSTKKYEFEIRLIENKEGNYNILIKLYTLADDRFSYRKNSIAASIQPVNAALMAALAKDYLKEGAQVLDPFCGVGTMLVERNFLVQAGTMYGLDIYREAIDKARENTKYANIKVNYINRNFFDFKHEYLFDEIFTNMPRAMGHKDEDEIFKLYQNFFRKAPEHLTKNGVMILYSHNRDYVKKLLNSRIYLIEQEFEISKKEGAYLFVIRYINK